MLVITGKMIRTLHLVHGNLQTSKVMIDWVSFWDSRDAWRLDIATRHLALSNAFRIVLFENNK